MQWDTPVWDHDLDKGLRSLRLSIDTHLITAHHLLPLLVDRPGGLHVKVTDGTAEYNASHYRINVFETVRVYRCGRSQPDVWRYMAVTEDGPRPIPPTSGEFSCG